MKNKLYTIRRILTPIILGVIAISIFAYKTQYLSSSSYTIKRLHNGETVIYLASGGYQLINFTENTITMDDVTSSYKLNRRGFRTYDIEFYQANGELDFKTTGATISHMRFIGHIDSNSGFSSTSSSPIDLGAEDRIEFMEMMSGIVLMITRYQILTNQLMIMSVILFPFLILGYIAYIKPNLLIHLISRFNLNEKVLPTRKVRITGIVVYLISLLLPFILLY
jgi:hypothetical protein